MKCVNHPESEAQKLCTICHAPVCDECSVNLKGLDYCKACLEQRVGEKPHFVRNVRSSVLTFLFSLLPGAGYMYLGLMNRGLQTMIIFFGTIFVSNMIHLDSLIPLVLPVLIFYSVFDTLQLSRRMQYEAVEDRPLVDLGGRSNWQNYLGYGLVGLGFLALVNNFVPYLFNFDITRRIISPLVIIAIGSLILYRNLRRRVQEDDGKGDC